MKTLIITIGFFFTTILLFAGGEKYQQAMQNGFEQMKKATDGDAFRGTSQYFERAANAEKQEWIPYYYASYCQVIGTFMDGDPETLDDTLDEAQRLLDEASKISENNSEIHVLQGFIYQARISKNPMMRGMTYSGKAASELKKAIELDPNNPRPHYLLGMNVYNTPSMFGGGASKALPHFEKASELYAKEKKSERDPFLPRWGEDRNNKLLAECRKSE